MAFLGVIAGLLYFGLGILQFAATLAGIEEWLGIHWILASLIALILAYIPLIGTIVGMFGAVEAWGWSWVQAGLLFFGPLVVIVILATVSGGVEALASRRR